MSQSNDTEEALQHLGRFLAVALRAAGFELTGGGEGARLLAAKEAAAYVGMGQSKFRELEATGGVPKRVTFSGMPRWDRRDLDKYVDRAKRSGGKG